jgi:acetyl/propionyl-CoA carboxylase alpha subunit/acetyl-CoA carboxylase carboxyltransferase component
MALEALLVANRGEIAIRVMRAAADLGVRCVAVYSDDDAASRHTLQADEARSLGAVGPAAYLDIDRILDIAAETGCDAIHPGYGFLSENPIFARRCEAAGLHFVGPTPETLELFGDKAAARALAERLGLPVLPGTGRGISAADAAGFLAALGPGKAMMIKATAGGGGRGQRIVSDPAEVAEAYARCQSEAESAFGDGSLFAEELLRRARHVEVQIIGDGTGAVSHLWERECSIQRRQQKLIEMAPSVTVSDALRAGLTTAAIRMARDVDYRSLGTFEFLVAQDEGGERYFFLEANPRLQVEHTVTEEILGVDLVRAQLEMAGGRSLADLNLTQDAVPAPRGLAIQARVNMETMGPDGVPRPSGGVLTAFEVPTGPGVRTDSFGYSGYRTSPRFDSLLAKVIVHTSSGRLSEALSKADRALAEFRIEGVATNVAFLRQILVHPEVRAGRATTRFVDDHLAELLDDGRWAEAAAGPHPGSDPGPSGAGEPGRGLAGIKLDSADPLAVLNHGRAARGGPGRPAGRSGPALDDRNADGTAALAAPMQGTIVQIDVRAGDPVRAGQQILVMEAMKMEHVVAATVAGYVRHIGVEIGDAVFEGHPLVLVEPADVGALGVDHLEEIDLDEIRPDLAEILERHAVTLDEARPDAVSRRRRTGQRTARENIADLCDDGTFVENGSLVLTPGSGLPMPEVIRKFPTDGMVCGVGSVNGDHVVRAAAQTVVLAYDYTVLAGTQGPLNHLKTDRMLELARKWKLPVVFFTEGGGGRAGTGGNRTGAPRTGGATDSFLSRPLVTTTFTSMARLNGVVPTVAINSGFCFAGNAALLGACDVVIATANSNIGMGGPAMIEGGGLGVFAPEEVGPMSVQLPNGVVDIGVEDEAEAVEVAKRYLSYFQGPRPDWDHGDQRVLRSIIPANRLRTYDIRAVIEGFADNDSVLEIRRHFGLGMVTALARIEGRPVGILANNPSHLAGAIDSDGADKAARFMQLLDAYDIPLVVLCDTPGIMVGPAAEETALVRHCNRLFVTGANLSVPTFMVVLRKAYGLGALAMGGGSVLEPYFTVAWPTAEFAGMGLEGQIKLGYRNELEMIDDPAARLARYEHLVAQAYERSKAIHQGVLLGVDDVIDPMDTRRWLSRGLDSVADRVQSHPGQRRVDVW